MFKLFLYIVFAILAIVAGVLIRCVIEGFLEGGFAISGSKKYKTYSKDADAKVKEILKNGTGSTKEELQEWWDTYHK